MCGFFRQASVARSSLQRQTGYLEQGVCREVHVFPAIITVFPVLEILQYLQDNPDFITEFPSTPQLFGIAVFSDAWM